MRHRKKTVKLGRTSAHRNELLANLVCALIDNKRIKTTAPKAKAARSLAEKMVTLGKKGTLAGRRQAIATLKNEKSVKELFDSVAPAFESRNGGYTRIIKLGRRISDSSEMVILEWVDTVVTAAPAVEAEAPVVEEAAVAAE
jgi:large subunit ribosomal protein L17